MTFAERSATVPLRAITAGTLHWPAFLLALAMTAAVYANSPAARITKSNATSERAAREEAVRAMPWRLMAAQHRRAAQSVINNTSIYRRLPTRVIDCDPEIFTFLIQHPEVVIDVWRVMGLSQVSLNKLPSGAYQATDGAGTSGNVRFLYTDWKPNAQNMAVVHADGAYEGKPFVAPLKAQTVLLLRSGAVRETNGRHYITVRIDSFVHIEQMGIELVAKTVQPWINKTADHNFIETLTFVSNFSRTAEQNPQGIERLTTRLPSLDEPTRRELVVLSYRTAQRYARRDTATQASAAILAHRADGNRPATTHR